MPVFDVEFLYPIYFGNAPMWQWQTVHCEECETSSRFLVERKTRTTEYAEINSDPEIVEAEK